MDREKISRTADACLAAVENVPMPFSYVRDFISLLQDDPQWTEAEISQVQMEVIQRLMKSLPKDDGP